jgi:gamma-glutamyl:cysteine ligase YbdK (ATP-grasp superfamily)
MAMEKVYDTETGEAFEVIEATDLVLERLITKRHGAKIQEKEWGDYRKGLDAQLLKTLDAPVVTYADLVCRVCHSSRPETDATGFAAELIAAEVSRDVLIAVIAAAKGFSADDLPPEAREAFAHATCKKESALWIQTAPVRKIAPRASEVE